MDYNRTIQELKQISLSMFRKSFLGVFHGSISARIAINQFVINKKDAIFDNLKDEDLVSLYTRKDYRWKEASIDSDIHLNIYKNINEAKFVCVAMPPYLTAYTLNHEFIMPKDYFGALHYTNLQIYDPKQFCNWYERAPFEVYRYMQENSTNIIIVRGIGVIAYARTSARLAKFVAILENSCKLLHLSETNPNRLNLTNS